MGCGSSLNQVSDYQPMIGSSKPLRLDQMFHSSSLLSQLNKIYLFGQTLTKRKILQLSLDDKSQTLTLKKLSERYHIPRPKIQLDTIQMMYEEAQQVVPLNMYNSTTLPPFNLMFVTFLGQKVLFLCGGIDFQFWNVCAQSFLYKIASPTTEEDKLIKVKLEKPETNIISQRTTNVKENASRRAFNKFERLAFMNEGRYSHTGLSIKHPTTGKNFVYVFGGFNSNKETLKSCQVYSFEKNIWQKMPDMKIARATGFCFEYLHKIYVCGGFVRQGKRSKKIQVWDLETQKWSVLNIKLHQGIQQGFITSFSPNEIAIIGGNIEGGPTHSVVRFNVIQQTYKWDSDIFHSDSLQKAFNYEGKLYLFGGKKPGFCQTYNSSEKSWNQNKIVTSQQIRSGELTMFSSSSKSLIVDFAPISNSKKDCDINAENMLVYGTDFYPILYFYRSNDLFVTSNSISMKLRMRKFMGILRLSEDEYFLCGGIDTFETNATKATFKYKFSSRQVQELDKMPSKKYKFGLIRHKNHVYNIGGVRMNEKKEEVELKECSRYNLLTKKWQKVPDLNFHRSQCEVVETQNGFLVFGGYADGEWVDKIEFLSTQSDKSMEFVILIEKLPLMFPTYSKIVSIKKDNTRNQTIAKLFILNRNIHLNNFEEVYFNIKLTKICRKQMKFAKEKKQNDFSLNKLQQFDSIDVIITERQKTLEQENSSRAKIEKKKNQIKEENESNSGSEAVDITGSPLMHKKESRVPKSKKAIKDSTEKIFQQEPKLPSVQTILIKSKSAQNELDQNMNQANENQSKKDSHKNIQNSIHRQITQNSDDIEEMSLEFEKISLSKGNLNNNTEPIKIASTNAVGQKEERYENLKSQPMEDYESSHYEKKGTSMRVQPELSQEWLEKESSQEPHFIEECSKKVLKGLECIDSINEWIKLRQTAPLSRVAFIKNQEVVKCNFVISSSQKVQINIVKEKYENGELLFDKTNNNKTHTGKLHTSRLKQNYA